MGMAGDFEQLVWEHSYYFGVGLSYNSKKKAGYVVMFFNNKFIEGESDLDFKIPKDASRAKILGKTPFCASIIVYHALRLIFHI